MVKIAVIIGSTRPGRVGETVAKWVYELAKKRMEAEFELVDIKGYNLPLLDEPVPPSMGQYSQQHTKTWAAKIDSFDGYVFVTPEYNHGICGALKNAIDFLFAEWNNKAAGFVGYGSVGGVRAVEHLRLGVGGGPVAPRGNPGGRAPTVAEEIEAVKARAAPPSAVAELEVVKPSGMVSSSCIMQAVQSVP